MPSDLLEKTIYGTSDLESLLSSVIVARSVLQSTDDNKILITNPGIQILKNLFNHGKNSWNSHHKSCIEDLLIYNFKCDCDITTMKWEYNVTDCIINNWTRAGLHKMPSGHFVSDLDTIFSFLVSASITETDFDKVLSATDVLVDILSQRIAVEKSIIKAIDSKK